MVADSDGPADASGVTPLARLVREAMAAAELNQRQASVAAGLSRQLINQVVNRRVRYSEPPKITTIQGLAKLPGLTLEDVISAVEASTGIRTRVEDTTMSMRRRQAHEVIDAFSEDDLAGVLQVLNAWADRR